MPPRRFQPRSAPGRLEAWGRDIKVAAVLYTRLPLAHPGTITGEALARAQWAAPVIGAAVGLAGAAGFAVASRLALPAAACALIALAVTVLVTGALHEDGLADTADGLGGGRGRAEKLAIMRDSRIGGYGALALIFSVGLRVAALAALAQPGAAAGALIGAGAVSRGALPAVMARLDAARQDGLAAEAGRPSAGLALAAAGVASVIALLALGPPTGVLVLLAGGVAAAAVMTLARRQLGGHTGDVLGAVQQAAEVAALLTAAALARG
ncbi:MAG: adenosylcobinamide-GDP ribazoletransferase [Kiloniellales bacterium]